MGIEQTYPVANHNETASGMSSDSNREKDFTPPAPPPALAEHGPLVDHKIPQEDTVPAHPDLWWPRVRRTCREPFSEFFGTFILLLFGDGVVAQVVLSGGEKGDYQSISWGWG